jgi:hypothetical protein
LKWEKCFPLKPLWQLEPNFTEMVFRKSSIDNYHLVTMWQKSWPPIMQLFFFLEKNCEKFTDDG